MAKTLQAIYKEKVVPELMARFNYTNAHQVPRLVKIVVNRGLSAGDDGKVVDQSVEEVRVLTGQQPIVVKSKKAISNFKLRENQAIGIKVTMRRRRMYDFLSRLVNLALPRIRDFRGVPTKLDGSGNYSLGLKEQGIFPELSMETITVMRGMDICVHTTAKTDEEAQMLLKGLGMPFRERK